MWDTILVAIIVGLCAVLIGRKVYRQLKGKSACGCDCSSGCSVQQEVGRQAPSSANCCGCQKDANAD